MAAPDAERVLSLLKVLATVRKLKEDREPVCVAERLFVGSVGAAHNRDGLRAAGITHVLCVAVGLPCPYPADFKYATVEVHDTPEADLSTHFTACFGFIAEALAAGGGVFIHCFAGRSRSVTVLTAFLMRQQHLTLQAALALVHAVRPFACPNSGFMRQLQAFEAAEAAQRGGRAYHTRAAARLIGALQS